MNEKISNFFKYAAIAIVAVVIFFSLQGIVTGETGFNSITGNAVKDDLVKRAPSGEVQFAKLKMENYEYVVEPSKLKKGIPVNMEVDLGSVYGCMRDVVISSFGVRKYVSEGNNIVEFTPDKAGKFWVVCSMNMGRGQFEVVEQDGSESNFIENAPKEGGSCGSGGCGCGGGL